MGLSRPGLRESHTVDVTRPWNRVAEGMFIKDFVLHAKGKIYEFEFLAFAGTETQ